ncbi:MAG: ATP/GTP-binding protein [Methermicoccaceae archaeon]
MVEIKWHLRKHPYNNTVSIVIENCPECGREGTLISAGGGAFRIRHNDGGRRTNVGCRFGRYSEYYEELEKIWTYIRKGERKKKLLVGFSGSSGAGKTTLVNRLAEVLRAEGYNVGVVKEVVREVFRRNWQDEYQSLTEIRQSDKVLIFQREVLENQFRAEMEAIKNHEVVLTDRTFYDNFFFTMMWHNRNFRLLYEYLELFQEYSSEYPYDVIFLCPPLKHVDVNDGFRTHDDIEYRDTQYLGISLLIPDSIPKYRLEVTDFGLRVRYCLAVLEKMGLSRLNYAYRA